MIRCNVGVRKEPLVKKNYRQKCGQAAVITANVGYMNLKRKTTNVCDRHTRRFFSILGQELKRSGRNSVRFAVITRLK